MTNIKNILLPIDYSPISYKIFELGHRLAKLNNALLHLIHVIDTVYYKNIKPQLSDLNFLRLLRFRNAKEELQKFSFEVPHSSVKISEVLTEGIPHKEILKYAKKNQIDMIVIASHGWTNRPTIQMGSIADKVMQLANIPVVCIKPNSSIITNRELENQQVIQNWVA